MPELLRHAVSAFDTYCGASAHVQHLGPSPAQVDPTVSAAVWLASSAYFSHIKDFAEFYKSSLMYLAFVSSKDLEPDYRMVSRSAHRSCPEQDSRAADSASPASPSLFLLWQPCTHQAFFLLHVSCFLATLRQVPRECSDACTCTCACACSCEH